MKSRHLTRIGPARVALCTGIVVALAEISGAHAQSSGGQPSLSGPAPLGGGPPETRDSQAEAPSADVHALRALLEQRLSQHPALVAGKKRIRALEEKRIAASAFADPMLTLGIQNDGFSGLQIGVMESSYVSIMASQALTWPWTQQRARDEAEVDIQIAEQELKRVTLDLRRSLLRVLLEGALLEAQAQLLHEQQKLLEQLEALASARYQAGLSPQSELLRVRFERSGLQAQRLGLQQQQRSVSQALRALLDVESSHLAPQSEPPSEPPSERLVEPPSERLVEPLSLELVRQLTQAPSLLEADARLDAHQRSPERAILALRWKQENIRLAQSASWRLPAPSLSAGLMVRGALEPMWQLGVGVALPVWARTRQLPEQRAFLAQRDAFNAERDALTRTLDLRVQERVSGLERIREGLTLQREVRLPLSQALLKATLSEYEAGKGGFASVLDAFQRQLQVIQEGQALAYGEVGIRIDAEAVSLEPSEVSGSVGGAVRLELRSGGRSVGQGEAAEASGGASVGSSSSSSGMGM